MRRISHDMSGISQRLNHIRESFSEEVSQVAEIWLDVKGRVFLQQQEAAVPPTIGQLVGAIHETTELFESIAKKLRDPKHS